MVKNLAIQMTKRPKKKVTGKGSAAERTLKWKQPGLV